MTIINTSNSSSIIILILIGICLSLIALITALGNIVVLLAFYYDKNLRTINDYFILNMAIADFLVGSFCIPFYIPFSMTQLWPFGSLFCKIWITIDDVATMTSVINIVAISINRYWSIAYPISYRKYVKQHFVYLVMGAIWCFSFINFAPGIWLLSLFNNNNNNNNNNITRNDCSSDYNRSFIYMLIAQFNYFIWPFIVLCVLNMLIMLNIWKRSRKMSRLMSFNQYAKNRKRNIGSSSLVTSKDTEDDQHLPITHLPSLISSYSTIIQKQSSTINKKDSKETCKSLSMLYSSRKCANVNFSSSYAYRSDSFINYRIESETKVSRSIINELRSQNHLNNKKKYKRYHQCNSRIIRDRKAARSLFILVIVFLIFLFPYVICAIAITANVNISGIIFEISFWLLWLNSTCNPFLYPFIQIKYRHAYLKVFQSCLKYFTFSRSNHHSF